jgi:hypothetical protein
MSVAFDDAKRACPRMQTRYCRSQQPDRLKISVRCVHDEGTIMKLMLLRNFLLIDAAVLFLLGGLLIFFPTRVENAFHFADLPPGVAYIIGMWGCALMTMGVGYVLASGNPVRHILWVQVGILRGASECVLGAIFLARGVVTLQQAALGIITAAIITIGYLALYPRKPRLARAAAGARSS